MSKEVQQKEIRDLSPKEVSLTVAPQVQEEFLLMKSHTMELTRTEVVDLAKSEGVMVEDLTDEIIAKAETGKAKEKEELKKKSDEELSPEDKKRLENLNKQEPNEDEEEDDDEEEMKKSQEQLRKARISVMKTAASILGVKPSVIKKAVEDELKKGVHKPGDEEDDEIKKSQLEELAKSIPGLRDLIENPLKAEIEKSNKRLQGLEDERDLTSAVEIAKSMPGDTLVVANRLITLKKAMSVKEYDDYVEEQKGLKIQLSKSEVFKQMGSGRSVGGATAESKLQALADQVISKSGVTKKSEKADALALVMEQNPELTNEYNSDMEKAASAITGQEA